MSGEIELGPVRALSHVLGHAPGGQWGRTPAALVQRARTRFEAVPVMAVPPTVKWVQARGATAAAIAGGGSGYAVNDTITLAGGTFEYATRLRVTVVSSGVITGVSIDIPGVYTGTMPSNPMAQGSTSGSGSGATFNMTFGDGSASPHVNTLVIGGSTALVRATAHAWGDRGSFFYGNTTRNDANATVEFWTDSALPLVRMNIANQKFYVRVDGEHVKSPPNFDGATSGNMHALILDWGGVRKPRRYEIGGYNWSFGGLRLEGDATIWAPDDTPRPLIWVMGDSYTQYTGTYTGAGWVDVLSRGLDMDVLPYGIGGSGWLTNYPDGTNAPTTRIANVLTPLHALRPVSAVVIALGYNDSAGNQTNIQTSCHNTLEDLYQAMPDVPVFVIGPWTPLGSTTNLTTTKATIQAAIAAVVAAYPAARIAFIDIDDIVNSANKSALTGVDNAHPTPAGHTYLGTRIAAKIAAQIWPG